MTSAAAPNTSQVRHSPARDTQELGPRPERLTGPDQPCARTRGLGPRPRTPHRSGSALRGHAGVRAAARTPHRSGSALRGHRRISAAGLRPRPPGPARSSERGIPLGEGGMWTRRPKWHWVEYRFSGSKDCKQAPRKTVILPPKLVGLSMSEATTISLLIDFPSLAARS